jgi:ribosomal protein S30
MDLVANNDVVLEGTPVTPAKPKRNRKPAPKKELNYKVEYKKAQDEIAELKEKLEVAENKAMHYFNQYQMVEKNALVSKERVAAAKHHMTQAVISALSSYDLAVK